MDDLIRRERPGWRLSDRTRVDEKADVFAVRMVPEEPAGIFSPFRKHGLPLIISNGILKKGTDSC